MLTKQPLQELQAFFRDNLMAPVQGTPMRALLQAFADDRSIPLKKHKKTICEWRFSVLPVFVHLNAHSVPVFKSRHFQTALT